MYWGCSEPDPCVVEYLCNGIFWRPRGYRHEPSLRLRTRTGSHILAGARSKQVWPFLSQIRTDFLEEFLQQLPLRLRRLGVATVANRYFRKARGIETTSHVPHLQVRFSASIVSDLNNEGFPP